MYLLQCPNCGANLNCTPEECVCEGCFASWPVSNGIPRFFQTPDQYWGEVDRAQALEMIDAARRGSWSEAVRARFPEKDNMRFGLLDLQRASWAPMLGIGPESTVADIGSGYGCITHSLSRFAKEVYSVEAVTERIDFTLERLRQEGVTNVHLVQASATALPLPENKFDLVVVNGVLEWVGEWDLTLDPQTVQINFLRKICRLLKDDGLLLVGIENRIGLNMFLGGNDHSGIPYTSLVPRPVASFLLSRNRKSHYRTRLNRKKEYRTLTYSERGYRKLLRQAGFPAVSSYWADPGYNQPYSLVPLSVSKWIKKHFIELIEHPGTAPRRSWRRRLKRMAMPYFAPFVNDFVLLATKQAVRHTPLQTWIEDSLSARRDASTNMSPERLAWELQTGPFKRKSIVRLGDGATGREIAYLKILTDSGSAAAEFERERENRAKLETVLLNSTSRLIKIPKFYGTFQLGTTSYYLESASHGEKISSLVRRLGYFEDVKRVAGDFHQICDRIIDLTLELQRVPGVPLIDPSWLEMPEELGSKAKLSDTIERNRYFHGGESERRAWIQHGDLSVENTHLVKTSGEFYVFDWGDMKGGLPPLYDLIEFFLSVGYLPRKQEEQRFASEQERWMESFKVVFFSDSKFGGLVRELTLHACERLGVRPNEFPSILLEFLIVRCGYYRMNRVQRQIHVGALEICGAEFEHLLKMWESSSHTLPTQTQVPTSA